MIDVKVVKKAQVKLHFKSKEKKFPYVDKDGCLWINRWEFLYSNITKLTISRWNQLLSDQLVDKKDIKMYNLYMKVNRLMNR